MITTRKLSNGVRMVMEQMPGVQSIAIGVFVRTGAVDEMDRNAGISHFVEHMMFKGTESRDARTIAADIDRIGGQINAYTSKEHTCYYVKAVSENYRKAADVIVDMLEHSVFDPAEMDRERQVICEEIKMTKDSPDDVVHDTFVSQVFRGNPEGRSIIGTPSSLNRVTHGVITRYVREQYTRDSIVVSVAGKFDEDEICAYFENAFLSLGDSKPSARESRTPYKRSFRSVTKDIQQSHICLGTRGLPLGDDRSYAFQIMNNLLGGSMSSRLFQNIREQKGLAYSVFSSSGGFRNAGYFEIYAGVAHDRIRKAIEGIREEIDRLGRESVSQDELDSSREQIKSIYVFSQESSSARMMINGKNFLLKNKVYMPEEVLDGYNSVTIDDIDRIKKLITDFDTYSATVVSGKPVRVRSMME